MLENEIDIGRLERENSAEDERLPKTNIAQDINDDEFPPEEEQPVQPQGLKMIGPDFINGMIERVNTEAAFCAFNLGKIAGEATDIEERMKALATHETISTALDLCRYIFQCILDGLMDNEIGSRMSDATASSIPAESLSILPSVLSNTISWKPSGPLNGDESEWVDITDHEEYKNLIGKIWWLSAEHIDGTGILIESVQYNTRCKFVRRFNKDNRLAHRVDGQKFIDNETEEEINPFAIRGSTIRFITFPYIYTEPNLVLVDTSVGKVVDVLPASNIGLNSLARPQFVQEIIDKYEKDCAEDELAEAKESADDAGEAGVLGLRPDLRNQIMQMMQEDDSGQEDDTDGEIGDDDFERMSDAIEETEDEDSE